MFISYLCTETQAPWWQIIPLFCMLHRQVSVNVFWTGLNLISSKMTLASVEWNEFEAAKSSYFFFFFFCLSSTEGYILLRLFFKNRCEILKIVYSGHGNVGSSQTKWHLANQVSKITNFQKVKPVVWVSPPLCHRNTLKTQAKKSGLLTPYMFS